VRIQLDLAVRTEGTWTVLDVAGEVDLYTAPSLRDRLVSVIDDGATRALVNLAEVGFMDSSGLGVLVGGLKHAKERGGELALVCVDGPVLKVLTITGLDKVFPIFDTVEAASGS
jgi:anti-sigma B factor antagonist